MRPAKPVQRRGRVRWHACGSAHQAGQTRELARETQRHAARRQPPTRISVSSHALKRQQRDCWPPPVSARTTTTPPPVPPGPPAGRSDPRSLTTRTKPPAEGGWSATPSAARREGRGGGRASPHRRFHTTRRPGTEYKTPPRREGRSRTRLPCRDHRGTADRGATVVVGVGRGNRKSKTGRRPSKPPAVLDGHQRRGKRFIPPLMQFDNLKTISWHHEMLPDFLWIAMMMGRRSDWRAVYGPLDVLDRFVPEGDRIADGRLCSFALVPKGTELRRGKPIRNETPHALPTALGHALALFPTCPASWLFADPSEHRNPDPAIGLPYCGPWSRTMLTRVRFGRPGCAWPRYRGW